VFKSRDVIFEEGKTNYTSQPEPTRFSIEDDPLPAKLTQDQQTWEVNDHSVQKGDEVEQATGIALRPHDILTLHPSDSYDLNHEQLPPQRIQKTQAAPESLQGTIPTVQRSH